jgi:hypothetical protein
MKIKANKIKIQNFPKKDVNMIIGFIIDNNIEPLVLCSNGCTLFYSDVINNFEIIDKKSKKWNKLKINPIDMNKIKLQPGDIIKYHKNSLNRYLVSMKYNELYLVKLYDYYHSYHSHIYLNTINKNEIILDCIPNPRIYKKEFEKRLISTNYI